MTFQEFKIWDKIYWLFLILREAKKYKGRLGRKDLTVIWINLWGKDQFCWPQKTKKGKYIYDISTCKAWHESKHEKKVSLKITGKMDPSFMYIITVWTPVPNLYKIGLLTKNSVCLGCDFRWLSLSNECISVDQCHTTITFPENKWQPVTWQLRSQTHHGNFGSSGR